MTNIQSCWILYLTVYVYYLYNLTNFPTLYLYMSSCTESSVLQLKLKALILDIIHNISVVKQLNQAGVTSPDAWAWKKQLRFYMGTDKCCHIHMVDAQFSYTYEYQVCMYGGYVLWMNFSFVISQMNTHWCFWAAVNLLLEIIQYVILFKWLKLLITADLFSVDGQISWLPFMIDISTILCIQFLNSHCNSSTNTY